MPGCANCRVAPAAPLLFQIRRRYCAGWNGLELAVESDSSQWTLSVRSGGRILYTAYRGNRPAAQLAAAEFAITYLFGFGGAIRPNSLAHELIWRES